jgi:hypothetical protein
VRNVLPAAKRVVLIAWVCVASHLPAWASPTPQRGIQSIAGSYNCTTQDGHHTWHFHSVNAVWGAWLRLDTTYSPQNGAPADIAQTFVGFDNGAKRWNIVSIHQPGSYYTRHSESRKINGSRWIDDYPADGGRATLNISGSGYRFDLTTPNGDRSAHVQVTCTRA